jgi:putative ABC transport system ATP-binding protein
VPRVAALTSVVKEYTAGDVKVQALRGIDLELEEGEFVALVGPSGSGKSTLLNLLGCMDLPTSGQVTIGGEVVSASTEIERSELRLQKLGFVFQNFSLIPVLTVFQNVELPLLIRGDLPAAEQKRRVDAILERVGLISHRSKLPNQLSGGQQQRAAVARALVGHPKLIIADEPTANLDGATGQAIMELIRELNRSEKTTVLYSTHDAKMMSFADRIVRIADGQILPGSA